MPYLPRIPENSVTRQVVDVFGGYNHNMKIADGEFYDMENLTGAYYPLLSSRDRRGLGAALTQPKGLLAKGRLAWIDGQSLYYDGADVTSYLTAAGAAIGGDSAQRQLVSMGAYICIFPDKLYFNTENYDDCGSLEASFTASPSDAAMVGFSICAADGTAYAQPTVAAAEPEAPADGALWIDSSSKVHALRQYAAATRVWTEIPTVYVKISAAGIGAHFRVYDGVTLGGCGVGEVVEADGSISASVSWTNPMYSGITGSRPASSDPVNSLYPQLSALNGSRVVYDRGDDYIVVTGLLDQTLSQSSGSITVRRAVPDMDFVTEAQNRLWGCRYGMLDGSPVNEIYCCALGDATNWSQYLGLATDSYRASIGSDGPWTGAVTHLGCPIFFKENMMHRVHVSPAGAHRIVDTACRGVQSGSAKSLCVVNETLYYKSASDVCAYDGSLPVSVSAALGQERYSNAAAGSVGDRYYISMRGGAGDWHMFVLDTVRGFWHREDDAHALCFARCGGELYYIDADSARLVAALGSAGTPETGPDWSATSGILGYDRVERKYVGRLNLSMRLPPGSSADMYVQYDSDGIWRHAGHMDGVGTGTFTLPLRPRRCDHFRFRLRGRGEVRIYSLAKDMETGSDQ